MLESLLKAIKAEIETLKKYEDPRKSDYDFNQGYNQAIDEVLDVINTQFKPIEKGI